jgi:prepilin-type N-terminal cleavage/methylation domain-containing protein
MAKAVGPALPWRRGFSIIELLVVLLIFAILVAITVPSLISYLPERQLAAAGDIFANDFNYCRAKARGTGNTVYLAFLTSPDAGQVDAGLSTAGDMLDPGANGPASLVPYSNPTNPGVGRTAKEYCIVEARGRHVDVDTNGLKSYEAGYDRAHKAYSEKYTYLDWLRQYDNRVSAGYPVEPLFPYRRAQTSTAQLLDPRAGAFNGRAVPLLAYTQDLRSPGVGGNSYRSRFVNADPKSLSSPAAGDWAAGDPGDQQYKVFCVADEQEVLSYDADGDRVYTRSIDHPRLADQVVDYVLLKRVKLPEHIFFLNPWRSEWVVGFEGSGQNRTYNVKALQFLQYLWTFHSNGELSLSEWTYDPEPFPNSPTNLAGLVHGTVRERDNLPAVRTMWMVTGECVDFGAPATYAAGGATLASAVSLVSNKRCNLASNGRMFTIWPLNGKYYVDDYTPNDRSRVKAKDDPRLDQSFYETAGGARMDFAGSDTSLSVGSREYGYIQNFLFY